MKASPLLIRILIRLSLFHSNNDSKPKIIDLIFLHIRIVSNKTTTLKTTPLIVKINALYLKALISISPMKQYLDHHTHQI